MKKFTLHLTPKFENQFKKLAKKDKTIVKKVDKAFGFLVTNPFHPSLFSHKVLTTEGKPAFSSKVTGDIRIVWDYQNGQAKIIDIQGIGGHSGKNKVYK